MLTNLPFRGGACKGLLDLDVCTVLTEFTSAEASLVKFDIRSCNSLSSFGSTSKSFSTLQDTAESLELLLSGSLRFLDTTLKQVRINRKPHEICGNCEVEQEKAVLDFYSKLAESLLFQTTISAKALFQFLTNSIGRQPVDTRKRDAVRQGFGPLGVENRLITCLKRFLVGGYLRGIFSQTFVDSWFRTIPSLRSA